MNGRLVLRMVPVLGALILFPVAPTVGALSEDEVYFFDDFNGSEIDANTWRTEIAMTGVRYIDGVWTSTPAEASYGSITVADSRISLANPSPTLSYPLFPLIWTSDAIPATGNFELEFRMRYTEAGFWGDGVRIVRMPTAFEPAQGSTESAKGENVLMIHQDNHDCKGPNVSIQGHPGEGSSTLPFNTEWHTYTLKYEGDASTLYVDGVYFDGPLQAPRPNCIQLGVGEVGVTDHACDCCGCLWTSYTVDYIRVKRLVTTPVRKSGFSDLKTRFR